MKKIFSIVLLLCTVWCLFAQTTLQEIPANCIVYVTGRTSSVMKDPVTGRMICMFLTKNKLTPADLSCEFSGGITLDGSAKIVARLQTPKGDQLVKHLLKKEDQKRIRVSADRRQLTFLSAEPRKQPADGQDRRKEFSRIVASIKKPVFVLAFLGTDVPEGMEGNLIWAGIQRYADNAVFSMEELAGGNFLCQARFVCSSAADAERCREKLNYALAVIAEAEQSTQFTKRIQISGDQHILTVKVSIQSVELLACVLRLKFLLDHFDGGGAE